MFVSVESIWWEITDDLEIFWDRESTPEVNSYNNTNQEIGGDFKVNFLPKEFAL